LKIAEKRHVRLAHRQIKALGEIRPASLSARGIVYDKRERHCGSCVASVAIAVNNSSAIFQKFINATFQELIANGTVLTYLDDLIIPSRDAREGVQKLRDIFNNSKRV